MTPEITDQLASECVKIYYATTGRPATAMRAALEFAFGHREPDAGVTDAADASIEFRIATALAQRNAYKGELDIATARIAELEANVAVLEASGKTLGDAYTRLMTRIPSALSPSPGESVWAATEAALDRALSEPPVGTIRLGEGLTEAQEGWSAERKTQVAATMDNLREIVEGFSWDQTTQGFDFWRNVHISATGMTESLRASAAPKVEAVDWVKAAEECLSHNGPGYDRDAIMTGLCEQIAALRAKGGV